MKIWNKIALIVFPISVIVLIITAFTGGTALDWAIWAYNFGWSGERILGPNSVLWRD